MLDEYSNIIHLLSFRINSPARVYERFAADHQLTLKRYHKVLGQELISMILPRHLSGIPLKCIG